MGGETKIKTGQQPLSGSFSHQKVQEDDAGSVIRPRLPPGSSLKLYRDVDLKRKLVLRRRRTRGAEGRPGGSLGYEETVTGLREPFRL